MPYEMKTYRTDKLFVKGTYRNGMEVYYLADREQYSEIEDNLDALIRSGFAAAMQDSTPVKKFPGHMMDQVHGRIEYCECNPFNE
jgi:hypothetical protein